MYLSSSLAVDDSGRRPRISQGDHRESARLTVFLQDLLLQALSLFPPALSSLRSLSRSGGGNNRVTADFILFLLSGPSSVSRFHPGLIWSNFPGLRTCSCVCFGCSSAFPFSLAFTTPPACCMGYVIGALFSRTDNLLKQVAGRWDCFFFFSFFPDIRFL